MAYTTEALVRDEAGFTWNTDISADTINAYISEANAYIQWVVWWVYDLSLFTWDAFTWSQAETRLKLVERYLAAGLLLNKEFGTDDAVAEEWVLRIERAEWMLEQLRSKTMPVKLLDANWDEFATVASSNSGAISMTWVSDGDYEFSLDDEF